ncbi:DUF2513 domain-containing protein [Paraburkholderia sp. 22099]|uniref:DUF2513 domain-containing protein n=1 Tax=Paraburkholderia sp. 22099 TaxID=3453875 RepID=UPI003F8516F5
MDLIRELLLKLEELPLERGAVWLINADMEALQVSGYSADQIDYHLSLIEEAGLTDSAGAGGMDAYGFRRLSWAGHDFLDSVRDPEVWRKTKAGALAAGGFTVELLADLAKGFIKKQIEDRTGVRL